MSDINACHMNAQYRWVVHALPDAAATAATASQPLLNCIVHGVAALIHAAASTEQAQQSKTQAIWRGF